jgi:hypothetical protein
MDVFRIKDERVIDRAELKSKIRTEVIHYTIDRIGLPNIDPSYPDGSESHRRIKLNYRIREILIKIIHGKRLREIEEKYHKLKKEMVRYFNKNLDIILGELDNASSLNKKMS